MLFFFTDPPPPEIYTLSLHDALPISAADLVRLVPKVAYGSLARQVALVRWTPQEDRKSTRLNSSHQIISYAVFCLKKKKNRSTSARFYIDYPVIVYTDVHTDGITASS